MYVTEDTTRARPEAVKKLYTTAIECGARAIVVCDTVGHATPRGVRALLDFVREEVVKPTGENVRIDWHGHSDRGLAVANSLAAYEAGADSVHASALGIGERVGNTPMDQMLVNLKLMGATGWADRDLRKLKDYCIAVSEAVNVPASLSGITRIFQSESPCNSSGCLSPSKRSLSIASAELLISSRRKISFFV